MRGDVAFLARDAGLQLGHAVQVSLVVALVAEPLGFAVVVFVLQRGQALFLALAVRASRMRRASLSRARCSVGVDALLGLARAAGRAGGGA